MKASGMWVAALAVGWLCGCGGPGYPVERAVVVSLAPETARGTWAPLLKDPSPTAEAVRKGMGAENFTSFYLTRSSEEMAQLRENFEWILEGQGPAVLARYLADHGTAVARKDIRDLQWTAQPGGLCAGSFSVATPYGLKAKLLFEARPRDGTLAVTKLAVAKKQSSALAEGFPIFEKQ